MYSWLNSRSSTFCPLLPLMPSGVSLETAANFLLFRIVAIFLEEKILSLMKTQLNFFVIISNDLLLVRGKSF